MISPLADSPDRLNIIFRGAEEFFRSKKTNVTLIDGALFMWTDLGPQVKDASFLQKIEEVAGKNS